MSSASPDPQLRLDPPPTTRRVAAAVSYRRELLDLSLSELAYVVRLLDGPELTVQRLSAIEQALEPATVDELTVLAVALDTSPLQMLTHPIVDPELGALEALGEPPCTGLPADVTPREFTAWMHGLTTMRAEDREAFAEKEVQRTQILATFHADQLAGAQAELEELGELALREAKAPTVVKLVDRIHAYDGASVDAERAASMADDHYEEISYRLRHAQDPEPIAENDAPIRIDDEMPFD